MTDVSRIGAAAERRIAPAVAAAELALAAVLAVFAGLLVWALAAPESAVPVSQAARPAAAAPSAAPAAMDWSILWRINPFAPSGAVAADAPQEVPETTLNLALFGVRTQVGDAPGTAIIRTPDNRQGAFREGEEVIPRVTLDRVLADRVVISRAGVAETLYLEGARRTPQAAQAAPASRIQPAPGAVFSAQDVYDAAEFRAVMRQGRLAGLRIASVRNPDLLARAGLKEDDVLIQVAGRDAADLGDIAGAFERLEDAGRVDMIVERDGVQTPMTIEFGAPE